jgi:GTPase SAR1 family protein
MKKDKTKKIAMKKNSDKKVEVAKIVIVGDGACGKVYNLNTSILHWKLNRTIEFLARYILNGRVPKGTS